MRAWAAPAAVRRRALGQTRRPAGPVVVCPPMRRLARRLFTLCSAASLLLFVMLCVLWVRSYREVDGFKLSATVPDPAGTGLHLRRHYRVESSDGTLRWSRAF